MIGDKNGPKAKGTAFLGVIRYVKSRDGELLGKIIAGLPEDLQPIFKRRIFAVADFPYPAFTCLIRSVDKILGTGDLTLCRELGKFTAVRDIETIYNIYKVQARPEDLSRDSDVIWKSYYVNAGRMETVDVSPAHTMVRIYDFPGMDEGHCRLMEGWMMQAIIESGGRWIEQIHETKCQKKGAPFHQFEGKWERAGAN